MTDRRAPGVRPGLVERAQSLGADLVSIAAIDDLRSMSSRDAGTAGGATGTPPGDAIGARAAHATPEVSWPEGTRSIVVVALAHPPERPELDWWFGRSDPAGNRLLAGIVQGLCDWLTCNSGMHATHLPYHVERGGTYLKDAAVLAGLGYIGRNNLLVTPQYGPRARLRALTVDARLPSTGPSDFDPCRACDAPCRAACPQGAFAYPTAPPLEPRSPVAQSHLPARDGAFARLMCYRQMDLDVDGATGVIRYCRACELSCRVPTGPGSSPDPAD